MPLWLLARLDEHLNCSGVTAMAQDRFRGMQAAVGDKDVSLSPASCGRQVHKSHASQPFHVGIFLDEAATVLSDSCLSISRVAQCPMGTPTRFVFASPHKHVRILLREREVKPAALMHCPHPPPAQPSTVKPRDCSHITRGGRFASHRRRRVGNVRRLTVWHGSPVGVDKEIPRHRESSKRHARHRHQLHSFPAPLDQFDVPVRMCHVFTLLSQPRLVLSKIQRFVVVQTHPHEHIPCRTVQDVLRGPCRVHEKVVKTRSGGPRRQPVPQLHGIPLTFTRSIYHDAQYQVRPRTRTQPFTVSLQKTAHSGDPNQPEHAAPARTSLLLTFLTSGLWLVSSEAEWLHPPIAVALGGRSAGGACIQKIKLTE